MPVTTAFRPAPGPSRLSSRRAHQVEDRWRYERPERAHCRKMLRAFDQYNLRMARVEHDPLGEHTVPDDAYYGIQTVRASENFPISGLHAPADLVSATVLIKRAAALANVELGRLEARIGDA